MLGRVSHVLLIYFLVILLHGGLAKKSSKSCKINGVTFSEGQVALVFQDFCAQFVCRPKLRKNGKGKTSKKLRHLVLEPIPLAVAKRDGCRCQNDAVFWDSFLQDGQERSKRSFSIPSVSRDQHSSGRQRQKRTIVRRSESRIKRNENMNVNQRRKNNNAPPKKKNKVSPRKKNKVSPRKKNKVPPKKINNNPPRKKNKVTSKEKNEIPSKSNKIKCKFNNERYTAGSVLATLQERCIRIVCLKVNNQESALAAELTTDCECSDDGMTKPLVNRCKYSEFSKDHSMCLTKTACSNIRVHGLTDAEKGKVLDLHNQYRAKVAQGEETRGNPGPQPSASNMRQLTWNDELARVAQSWANTCPTGHDCSACRRIFQHDYQVGQNLYWYWGWEASEKWDQAMSGFYDEVADVPDSLVEAYGPIQTENQIGHYTQLVWADTDAVGCGAVNYGPCKHDGKTYEECKVYVCNYGQAGNWLGLPIYDEGPPASDCTREKSNKYSGLCL